MGFDKTNSVCSQCLHCSPAFPCFFYLLLNHSSLGLFLVFLLFSVQERIQKRASKECSCTKFTNILKTNTLMYLYFLVFLVINLLKLKLSACFSLSRVPLSPFDLLFYEWHVIWIGI